MAKEIAIMMSQFQFDEYHGTVRDRGDFRAEKDAEALRKAMKGLGEHKRLSKNFRFTHNLNSFALLLRKLFKRKPCLIVLGINSSRCLI